MRSLSRGLLCLFALWGVISLPALADPDLTEHRVRLDPSMVVNESDQGDPAAIVDEQDQIIGPPAGNPGQTWQVPSRVWREQGQASAYIDLGRERNVSTLWIYDTNGKGDLVISAGEPGNWREVTTYDCGKYRVWVPITMDLTTRYIRFTKMDQGANFSEIAVYEYTPEAYQAMVERKAAEEKARQEREAALAKAQEEMRRRPLVEVGEPFGKLYLIDEVDCTTDGAEHMFSESPAGVSRVETILGKRARVLQKTEGEAAYISYRLGRMKMLEPGMTYVLEVEYPEDAPRSYIVMNGGDETGRGFHTGPTFGDALHPKYVNNNNESIDTPLSGKYETWNLMFQLHDRTPNRDFIRGPATRPLTAEEGFTVTIAQFSARDIPASHGAAVSRIRLLAVPDPSVFDMTYQLPEGLPHRHLFWREEMSDGVVGYEPEKEQGGGLADPIDWWRFKRDRMKFLGMNTFTKDLLEFGACQHWDSSEYGGNRWVYFNVKAKDTWSHIVALMGEAGFNVLPYYEYSGSKGSAGLGPQRRAKPLTRDDGYSHIRWIESANADITDPDTYEDFKKMLDLTILRHTDKARFVGAWLRPRAQLPMSFADPTRARFAAEANNGVSITRAQLIDDPALLERYKAWWYTKRRDFLIAMRDYLRENGVNDAIMLYTTSPSEPGVSFRSWEPTIVTDNPSFWRNKLTEPLYMKGENAIRPIDLQEVVSGNLYLKAQLEEPLTWGGWEVNHGSPPSDPHNYKNVEGVMLTHAFNRLYTVIDPDSFDAFRNETGLAIVRHYTLNENMMFDKEDKAKLGYFVADVERAGPFSMLAEAHAMAHGDPTHIAYLVGSNFNRGFPRYARDFNAAFLSLPALPSTRLPDVTSDAEVVVRAIRTPTHGTYLIVVNTGFTDKTDVAITLPVAGDVTDAPTGAPISVSPGRTIVLSLYPCQLRALRIQ
jgi:hypothetical protein